MGLENFQRIGQSKKSNLIISLRLWFRILKINNYFLCTFSGEFNLILTRISLVVKIGKTYLNVVLLTKSNMMINAAKPTHLSDNGLFCKDKKYAHEMSTNYTPLPPTTTELQDES